MTLAWIWLVYQRSTSNLGWCDLRWSLLIYTFMSLHRVRWIRMLTLPWTRFWKNVFLSRVLNLETRVLNQSYSIFVLFFVLIYHNRIRIFLRSSLNADLPKLRHRPTERQAPWHKRNLIHPLPRYGQWKVPIYKTRLVHCIKMGIRIVATTCIKEGQDEVWFGESLIHIQLSGMCQYQILCMFVWLSISNGYEIIQHLSRHFGSFVKTVASPTYNQMDI